MLLGVIAPYLLRLEGNNVLVIVMVVGAAIYGVLAFWLRRTPSWLYPVLLFAISLSVLFCFVLRFNHVLGNDVHLEYYEFRMTDESSRWNPGSLYGSMLSITILPTMVSSVTGLPGELLFRLMYPCLLSLVPVVLYGLFSRWMNDDLSFASALFFMANTIYFLQMPSLARQSVSFLFLALVANLLARGRSRPRTLSMIMLSVGLMTSHYTTSWVFLLLLFAVLLYSYVPRWFATRGNALEKLISPTFFLVVFALTFTWGAFVSLAPFVDLTRYSYNVFLDFQNFLVLQSRGRQALELVGLYSRQGFPNVFGYWLGNVIRILIVIGLVVLYFKPRVAERFRIPPQYVFIGLASMACLVSFIVLPYVTKVYNLDRLYLTFLMFLVPFLPIGAYTVLRPLRSNNLFRKSSLKILLTVLFILQMFYGTGLLHQLTGYRSFTVLNDFQVTTTYNEISPDARYYVLEAEVSAVNWLARYVNDPARIMSDHIGRLVMSSQALIPYQYASVLHSNSTSSSDLRGHLVYLRAENTMYQKIWISEYADISDLIKELQVQNKVYDSRVALVYEIL